MLKAKNGKIEFMRMIFCLGVIAFHINIDLDGITFSERFSFFSRGYIGVEFFFLVSGYLLAASIFKNYDRKIALGKDTVQFMYRKIMGILPYHLIVFVLTYLAVLSYKEHSLAVAAKTLFQALPNLFLIQQTGIYSVNLLSVEWYISAMLISMAVIYPLCRKYYEVFSRIIAPVAGVVIIGSLSHIYGTLDGANKWSAILPKTFFRSFAEICLGIFCFEVVRYIRKLNFSKVWKVCLTAVEIFGYIAAVIYMVSNSDRKNDAIFLLLIMLSMLLSFSEVTYGCKLFNNKFVYFLGRFSLPAYLCQSFARTVVNHYFNDLPLSWRATLAVSITLLLALAVLYVGKKLQEKMLSDFKKLKS